MRAFIASTAAAGLATALALATGSALAEATNSFNSLSDNTNFDLGINVSNLPLDPLSMNAFMASLAPETQSVILSTCINYVQDPGQTQSPDTVPFCRAVLASVAVPGVTNSTQTFATTSPLILTSPPAVVGGGAASGHRYNVFREQSDPNFGTDASGGF